MRFTPLAILLAYFATVTLASYSYDDLGSRGYADDDALFDAREVLEYLGIDAQALRRAPRSVARLEHLEARVESLERELVAREPSKPVKPPIRMATSAPKRPKT